MSRFTPNPLPIGLYDRVVDSRLEELVENLPPSLKAELEKVDPAELPRRIGDLVANWVADTLSASGSGGQSEELQRILGALGRSLATPVQALRSVSRLDPAGQATHIRRPASPLADTFLLTNSRAEPSIGHELESEIYSADRIDLIMAFIRWTGIRLMLEPLRRHVEAGRPLRILTTCYTGSTELKALTALADIGADIRVSYDTTSTRLHAKAWLFGRDSGFSTAYVGSSNLTHSAQISGVEWNVRVSEVSAHAIVEKFETVFDSYWADASYEPFDPARFAEAVDKSGSADGVLEHLVAIRPFAFQQAMLESLALERENGRNRNLVAAATGTGKTVVAALDYKRLRKELPRSRLLFVAHRQEILKQSQTMFRHVLGDGAFGELWVDGHRPERWEHVFASIQSISIGDIRNLPADHFDVLIVDEFHHAAANTYDRLLGYAKPKYLLGLTATPERTDEQDILHHFDDGRIAVELRLWDALEQGLLVPFHYFGIYDGTDLAGLPWKRGYSPMDLEGVYTADDVWAQKVLQAVEQKVADVGTMRAIGFCAGVGHARFMADFFNRYFAGAGVKARSLDGSSPSNVRQEALAQLRDGSLQALFAVDLFNEGLDIPQVDTLLMLRPTDSAIVFLQQLGRGLRRIDGKEVLTVLDFVGHQHERFRYETRYRRMLGRSRRELITDIENGFPYLPAGTRIHLDPVARDVVLKNIRNSLPTTWRRRVAELSELGDVSLADYLAQTGLDLVDVYAGDHCWTEIRFEAGFESQRPDRRLVRGVGRLLHVDDLQRIGRWSDLLDATEAEDERLLHMLLLTVLSPTPREFSSLDEAWAVLWRNPSIRREIRDLLAILASQRPRRQEASGLPSAIPIQTHATYARQEVFAAIGKASVSNPGSHREGVYYDKDLNLYLCFVTLQKTEKEFSPLTRYKDHAVSEELFHWETQHAVSTDSPTGRRLIEQRTNGMRVMVLVREARHTPDGRTAAFFNCGLADLVSHRATNPIQITWRLRTPLPGDLFAAYRAAVA